MRQFVRYHIWEPICTAAQGKVEVGDPDFDGVVVIIRRAIGVVFGVFEDDADFAVGIKIVKDAIGPYASSATWAARGASFSRP